MKRINENINQTLRDNGIENTPELNGRASQSYEEAVLKMTDKDILNHQKSWLENIEPEYDEENNIVNVGPIERHPYLYKYPIDIKKKRLVLGTFPPMSYLHDAGIAGLPDPKVPNSPPRLPYYYGNVASFWNLLFNDIDIYSLDPNNQEEREQLLEEILNRLDNWDITISDVFTHVQRSVSTSSRDGDLQNLILNRDICKIFDADSKIERVIFTSGKLATFQNYTVNALKGFYWILEECCGGLYEFEISGSLDGEGDYYSFNNVGIGRAVEQQAGNLNWWIKKRNGNEKRIEIINLPSPSGVANIGIPGTPHFQDWIRLKAKLEKIPLPIEHQWNNLREYCLQYPEIFTEAPINEYKREIYQMVLHNIL